MIFDSNYSQLIGGGSYICYANENHIEKSKHVFCGGAILIHMDILDILGTRHLGRTLLESQRTNNDATFCTHIANAIGDRSYFLLLQLRPEVSAAFDNHEALIANFDTLAVNLPFRCCNIANYFLFAFDSLKSQCVRELV